MMQGKYEIYWRKDQVGTPNEPISPNADASASPRNNALTMRKTAMIGVGALAARRAFSVVRQEIGASGNEELQNNIDNAMQLVGYGLAISATGWIGVAAVGVDIAVNAISYNRNLQRENTKSRINRELAGKRVNIAKGSVYYD